MSELIDSLIRVAWLLGSAGAVAIPTLVPKLRGETGKLNRWGILFLVAVFSSLGGGFWQIHQSDEDIKAILGRFEIESLRLRPEDFDLRLLVVASTGEPVENLQRLPRSFTANGTVGSRPASANFVQVGEPAPIPVRAGGQRLEIRYRSSGVVIEGFVGITYLCDLDRKTIEFNFPAGRIELVPGNWAYYLDTYVRGRGFYSGRAGPSPEITLELDSLARRFCESHLARRQV